MTWKVLFGTWMNCGNLGSRRGGHLPASFKGLRGLIYIYKISNLRTNPVAI